LKIVSEESNGMYLSDLTQCPIMDTSEICSKSGDAAFGKGKVKAIPIQAWTGPEVEAPRFQDNRLLKVVRFSAVRTGRLYPQGNIPGTHF